MHTFYQKHKKVFTIAMNALFWLFTCLFFVRFSFLRPMCNTHIYKELLCVLMILAVVLITRCITIPKLFVCGRYGVFWAVSVCMLVFAALLEILLVKPDIESKIYTSLSMDIYFFYIFVIVYLRDSLFFAWFLLLRLYILQRDAFRTKQRASAMEHRSVQFTLPDHTEVSIPIDLILYIQGTGQKPQVHCTDGEILTIASPLSYCKEMIPATLWTFDGNDKMVFHRHLSEYFTTQLNQEVREIKSVVLLSQRQFRIFEFIRQHPNCTVPFIMENMSGKHSLRTIEREIATLRGLGVIAHSGSTKGGGYEVVNCNVVDAE